jgi:hypothetical protein
MHDSQAPPRQTLGHESLVEAMNTRMEAIDAVAVRRETVEHLFSTIKAWMGATHFQCKGLKEDGKWLRLDIGP